ncbi:MAG TPA: DUF2249 domain-containing protein [Burkholderiales bacterium]|nr:DUF2249 domain-containing protein [Burkholderiales bacterium]
MDTVEPMTLDVRDMLRNGGEPLPQILAAVGKLKPEQPLRLLATFEPLPLYAVLGRKGYGHSARHIGEGDWEVLFTPGAVSATPAAKLQSADANSAASTANGDWPSPKTHLDNRGLQPPEPLVRILDALEHLAPGEVLEAINERDPVFLYPELEARGAAIRTEKRDDGGMRLLIRHGA